jgi:hypothetical protein
VLSEVAREHERRGARSHAAPSDVLRFRCVAVSAVRAGTRVMPHPFRDRFEVELLHALDPARRV